MSVNTLHKGDDDDDNNNNLKSTIFLAVRSRHHTYRPILAVAL
jgi:phosphatidylserine decarboxylase